MGGATILVPSNEEDSEEEIEHLLFTKSELT